MLARRTQTNEVARCATLLPLLARLPPPLALLEVGTGAGLCLLLDRYRYDYGVRQVGPAGSPVVLRCEARGATPVPDAVPEVVWRAGLDLDPLNVADPAAARWLEAPVWPGEGDRSARLAAAIGLARQDPPALTTGDMAKDVAGMAAGAPGDATLAVFHSAALAYVAPAGRAVSSRRSGPSGRPGVANEAAGVVASVSDRLWTGRGPRPRRGLSHELRRRAGGVDGPPRDLGGVALMRAVVDLAAEVAWLRPVAHEYRRPERRRLAERIHAGLAAAPDSCPTSIRTGQAVGGHAKRWRAARVGRSPTRLASDPCRAADREAAPSSTATSEISRRY